MGIHRDERKCQELIAHIHGLTGLAGNQYLTSNRAFEYLHTMRCQLHTTTDYYTQLIQTLGWELTVCNSLWPLDSPCRKILCKPGSYGQLLFNYLSQFVPLKAIRRVIEVGGGYGYLMHDFLQRVPFERVIMLDISPHLLQRQRAILTSDVCQFYCEDFLSSSEKYLNGIDFAILNENLGDFPTLTSIDGTLNTSSPDDFNGPLRIARELIERYHLNPSRHSLNVGALQALEKLCIAKVPAIFIGEHSCEAKVPRYMSGLVSVVSSGNPQRIALYGHDEYTIRFSDLERLAQSHGYSALRGPFADFLQWEMTAPVRRILTSRVNMKDDDEVIRHFVCDLYQYEYLLLTL